MISISRQKRTGSSRRERTWTKPEHLWTRNLQKRNRFFGKERAQHQSLKIPAQQQRNRLGKERRMRWASYYFAFTRILRREGDIFFLIAGILVWQETKEGEPPLSCGTLWMDIPKANGNFFNVQASYLLSSTCLLTSTWITTKMFS